MWGSYQEEDVYLLPGLVIRTWPIANGDSTEKFGHFRQFYGYKDVCLGINGNPGCSM